MDKQLKRLHLFKGYGIELEYMIVDLHSLDVRPLADQLIKKVLGHIANDVVRNEVTWSNELVMHVIELKCSNPTTDLVKLNNAFHKNIADINHHLKEFNACLMPTAAHPWMEPIKETRLWKYDQNEIYELYDKLFDCRGHGWSNLQSTHVNLPFYDDEEFAKLHAAVRLILPLIPAIAASSPIIDGQSDGVLDRRLTYYQKNQRNIPCLTANVIPERVYSHHAYRKRIYDPIRKALEPYNKDEILDPIWVNSRGAIARFDRGSIEIRLMDIQECPNADLAIVAMVVLSIKLLVEGKLGSLHAQQTFETHRLKLIFDKLVANGENGIIQDREYLELLDIESGSIRARTLWLYLYHFIIAHCPDEFSPWKGTAKFILDNGTLSTRILEALDNDFSRKNLQKVYTRLNDCLASNQSFQSWVEEKVF